MAGRERLRSRAVRLRGLQPGEYQRSAGSRSICPEPAAGRGYVLRGHAGAGFGIRREHGGHPGIHSPHRRRVGSDRWEMTF